MSTAWWPSGQLESLQQRAQALHAVREFFSARAVLEVDTPVLCAQGVTDPHIESLRLAEPDGLWLRTSPEYHMKRLLAAGSPDIYQIGKAFRRGERGSRHQPEFTLIEWYRLGFELDDIISDTLTLLETIWTQAGQPFATPCVHTYRDAFVSAVDIDPFTARTDTLLSAARDLDGWSKDLERSLGNDRRGLLDLLASQRVYPQLPTEGLQVITDYPAEDAQLARLKQGSDDTAARFEIFCNGLELANGFHELQDPHEQRRRFEADRRTRSELGKPEMDIDEHLLGALAAGLPDCAGVAVGLDRVLMVVHGFDAISQTLSFEPGR